MAKKCNRCEEVKSKEFFSVSRGNKDGYSTLCKACVCLRNKEYWQTPDGRISQVFANQTQSSKQRKHPAPQYSREQLTEWAYLNGLEKLVESWRVSGYAKNLIPSVDRINPNLGYELTNIRLVTWEENNDKAYEDRKSCKHITKQNKRVEQLTVDLVHVRYFDSIASAARATSAVRSNINAMCKGKPSLKSVGGFIWRYAI